MPLCRAATRAKLRGEQSPSLSRSGRVAVWPVAFIFAALMFFHATQASLAGVFVFANRTSGEIGFQVSPELGRPFNVQLASGEVRPVLSDERLQVAFVAAGERQSYLLDPDTAYYFAEPAAGGVAMRRIGLGEGEADDGGRRLPGDPAAAEPLEITVKILVDDDEPTLRALWEKKLRGRVAAASRALEGHAGVRLRVVGVGEWTTNNATNDFHETLREFEQQVDPGGARVAIGFTSQYEAPRGRVHLGGTRGPLSRHVMIREWSRHVSERERLELLLHELGHFFGATHSPEPDSVMRPVLGDRQARRTGFEVRYDPVNTLIMSMVVEEMRRRGVDRFHQLSTAAKRRLGQVYKVMGQAMPEDDAAKQFLSHVRFREPVDGASGARQVLQAIVHAARDSGSAGVTGDALTERLVRAACKSAAGLPGEEGPRAMLLALGIAMDDSTALRTLPLTRQAVIHAEPDPLRRVRLGVLGEPTLEGRRDLAKHFFVAAHLAAAGTPESADAMGISKEALDAQGGSGFSFADVAANRAGIRFARAVLAGRTSPERLAESFRPRLFMPAVKDLPEGLQNADFIRQFGGPGDERFERQLGEINRRIDALPAYAAFELTNEPGF